MMKRLLAFAAVSEAATGLVLLVYPPVVVRLLFGAEIAGAGVVVSRLAGTSLIALGLACFPGGEASGVPTRAVRAMLCYSLLAALYLAYLGIRGEWVGSLLWPATLIHALLTFFLARAWREDQRTGGNARRTS